MQRIEVEAYIVPLQPQATHLQRFGHLATKPQCILFDIYGTLFISGSGDIGNLQHQREKANQLETLLKRYSRYLPPEELNKRLIKRIKAEHQRLRADGIDYPEVQIDRIWQAVLNFKDQARARRFALEYEMIVNPVYPMPHLEQTLRTCCNQNIVLGVISNAQFYTSYLFQWFLNGSPQDIGFHPDLQFYSYRMGVAKPSIRMFESACKRLNKMNIAAHAALYIGNDMLNDMLPAQKAGLQTGLFAGDRRSLRLRKTHPDCANLRPDLIITALADIPTYW